MEVSPGVAATAVNSQRSVTFKWPIENFSKLGSKKLCSDVFLTGNYKWRLLVFPKGNKNPGALSIYLDVADSGNLPFGWCRFATFSFTVVNQVNRNHSITKETDHKFSAIESDWGFTSFMFLSELHDPSRGFIVNDTCTVEVHVKSVTTLPLNVPRKMEKAEENLYVIVKVAHDEDLVKQIGSAIHFDLVDHDKVHSFCVLKQTTFKLFKEEVAKVFGVPAQYQRFWLWAKRKNNTYRPNRSLNCYEMSRPVGQLEEVSYKGKNAELKLFLEVELGQDLQPMFPPCKTKEDILLFFKLYDPRKEELRYIGRMFVKGNGKPVDVLTKINELAGFAPDEEIELYEEIKFEPSVMCEPIDKRISFRSNQLENGDIICVQKSSEVNEQYRYPDIPSFLEFVPDLQVVRFRSLEKPKEDGFSLNLSKLDTYDDVVERVSQYLDLDVPSKIRLTSHGHNSRQPNPEPINYQGAGCLSDMLIHNNTTSNILYYEVVPQESFAGNTNTVEVLDATESNDADKEMDAFFENLEPESKNLSSDVKEALLQIEEALNLAPANFDRPETISKFKNSLDVLSAFGYYSTLTAEQQTELRAMEKNFKGLIARASKVVKDKNQYSEKKSLKLTVGKVLGSYLVEFKEAKAEIEEAEKRVDALRKEVDVLVGQIGEAREKKRKVFQFSKEAKAEMDGLEKNWPEYEAKMKAVEEEEKEVGVEWSKMKDFILSLKK